MGLFCCHCLRAVEPPQHLRRKRCATCYSYLRQHGHDRLSAMAERPPRKPRRARAETVRPVDSPPLDRRWQRLGDEVGTLSFAEWCAVSGYTPGARRYVKAQG